MKSLNFSLDFFRNATSAANCSVAPVLKASPMSLNSNFLDFLAACTSSAKASFERSPFFKKVSLFLLLASLSFLTGCFDFRQNYDQPAYRPNNPSKVVVKVSLEKQMIYVMEGNQPLLVTACCVGIPSKPTPKGNFEVTRKERNKRSGSYGFSIANHEIIPSKAENAKGRYVGYPMAYWVEFLPGYGFHQGCVWPVPRSHGCIRIHPNDACKFYELMHVGTPIKIANTQPEDTTLGAHFKRPTDYADPDPPSNFLISSEFFNKIKIAVFQEKKTLQSH